VVNDRRAKNNSYPVRSAALGIALALLAGCQSYEPRPLEPAAHREGWHARTLEAGSIRDFLVRLEPTLEDRAAEFDPEDGLTMREGQLVALVFNPDLRLARLRVQRETASAEQAGLWKDPTFSIDVLRVTESVPDRWVVTPSLAFTLPTSGRLGAERDLAAAEVRAERQRAREAEWAVWRDVRRVWVAWSAARLRVEETERLVDAMDALVLTAAQLAAAGELPRTEASLFALEQAQRRNQLRRFSGEVAAEEQRLRAKLGLAPEAPVAFVPFLGPGEREAEDTALDMSARNPTLARLRDEFEATEESLRVEIRKQYPDLTLGPLYEADQGQSRIGFLAGIPLPLWNANRQGIAEARVDREIARAAYETRYESLVGQWAALTARGAALADQRRDMEEVLVPMVDRQLADTLQLMRLGEGTSLVLLESLTRAQETKLELIDTRAAEAVARAEVEYLIGPPLPPTTTETPATDEEEKP